MRLTLAEPVATTLVNAATPPLDASDELERLIAAHEPRVRRLAHRLLGWRGDVDDLVQDVFLTAFKRLGTFRGEANLATWLARVTINRCRTYQRRQVLRLELFRRQRDNQHSSPADASALRDETSQRVRDAIAQLRAKDREVIVLFYLEELSIAEIAGTLNATNNAVEVRLHRSRQRLKGFLGDLVRDE
jgi:RNA polymerase sigma factor (sigma-70 family)